MLSVKEAVDIATKSFVELLGPSQRLLLEEVESAQDDGRKVWKITLSSPKPEEELGSSTLARIVVIDHLRSSFFEL